MKIFGFIYFFCGVFGLFLGGLNIMGAFFRDVPWLEIHPILISGIILIIAGIRIMKGKSLWWLITLPIAVGIAIPTIRIPM